MVELGAAYDLVAADVDAVEALADFAARVGADWLVGRRGWMPLLGPVRSNKFA